MAKKSQLAVFFLLGIVLVASFAILFFASGKLKKGSIDSDIEVAVNNLVKNPAVHEFVTSCLRKAAEEGLLLVGEQGGAIYSTQAAGTKYSFLSSADLSILYGIPVLPYNEGGVVFNVSYGIRKPRPVEVPPPPEYPYPGPLTSNPKGRGAFRSNHPGRRLAPLCIATGSNAYDLAVRLGVNVAEFNNTCLYSYGASSIQLHLQKFVENKTAACFEMSSLASMLGYNASVGKPEARVVIGEDEVGFWLTYPIKLTLRSHEPIVKRAEFGSVVRVRLKKIYLAAKRIALTDGRDIFFNPEEDAYTPARCFDFDLSRVDCLYEGMNVTIRRDVCLGAGMCSQGNYSDVYIITDNASMIRGKPYRFQFAVENRMPAIDLINQSPHPEFDIVVSENESIVIDPAGFDPDEDNYNIVLKGKKAMGGLYFYSGWGETCNSTFNFSWCSQPGNNCTEDPWTPTIEECFTDYAKQPMNWSRSELYIRTRRAASINLSHKDVGAHITRAYVCDPEGLCDFQNIRILVFDNPVAVPEGRNPYSDVPEQAASIEDPYILDASRSTVTFGGPIDIYRWEKLWGLREIVCEGGDATCTFPSATSINPVNILSMGFGSEGTKDFLLSVTVSPPTRSDSARMGVDVYKCLPHRSDEPSFPYNSGDPFQANHTCCVASDPNDPSTYDYAGTDASCFSAEVYASRYNLVDYSAFPLSSSITPLSSLLAASGGDENDVYLESFSRNCSGNRGNVCSGPASYSVSVYEACQNDNMLREKCHGPDRSLASGPSTSPKGCEAYTGTTFEELFGSGTGECSTTPGCQGTLRVFTWTCSSGACTMPKRTEDCASRNGCYDDAGQRQSPRCQPGSSTCIYRSYGCSAANCYYTPSDPDSDSDGFTDKCDADPGNPCSRAAVGDRCGSPACTLAAQKEKYCQACSTEPHYAYNSLDPSVEACCPTPSDCVDDSGNCLADGASWSGYTCSGGRWV